MLQSDLQRFLIQTESTDTDILAIPVLQVDTKPKEPLKKLASDYGGDGTEERTSPFSFTPTKIRLSKDHEIFEDGDIHRHLYLQDVAASAEEVSETPKVSSFRCHIAGCSQLFDTLEGYEHHYSSSHRHVCSTCKRSFPSDRLLDIHILEWHDSLFQIMAEKQSMYQCLVEGCDLKFKTSKERKNHLIKTHRYPPDFRFDRSKKSKRTQEKASRQNDVSMEVSEYWWRGRSSQNTESRWNSAPLVSRHAKKTQILRLRSSQRRAIHTRCRTPFASVKVRPAAFEAQEERSRPNHYL
ncbi:hypothetical protein AGOR_G00114200 [Albula goreensis]|uniref:C2H2-type domain-containing protein n=1 Tax=Albula goreensis TaxID=1534307 RepID=A0A8T3DBY0_9TELE|nr:hypothetical protein AGOR_G00114200 [Albula goreensis]